MRKLIFILLSYFLGQITALAQPNTSAFLHYTTDQGLSNDNVNDIVKDQLGFLWVATVNGLNRFDGHSFRHFFHDPQSPSSLAENYVKDLTLAPDGSLWATSAKGLCRIDPLTLDFRRFVLPENRDTLENDRVGRAVFGPDGMGWVCAEKGLYHFNPNSGTHTFFPLELHEAGYFDTYLDGTGRLWLTHLGRISYFDTHEKKLRRFDTESPDSPFHGASFMQVRQDQAGKIWIGSWFRGLLWYDPVQDSIFDFPDEDNSLASDILPAISEDGRPFLWLGGGAFGLLALFPETGESIQFPPDWQDPFRHNNYLASVLFKDKETDDVWIGTETGLEHYAPSSLRFGRVILPIGKESNQFSLMSGAVQDRTDPTGRTFYVALWGSGFYKWDRRRDTFQHFDEKNCGLRDNQVFCIFQDRQGFIWLGNTGVSRFDPRTGKWRSWDCLTPSTGAQNFIMCGLEDAEGRLWFGGSHGGLFHYNPLKDSVERVILPPHGYIGKDQLRITNMSLDEQGRIWMATTQQPLRFDPRTGRAEVFSVKNISANFNNWTDVQVASNGLLYVTAHDCLLEMDTTCTVLRKFNQANGLRSNQVYQIEEDRQGKIWFNTSYLLHCFDPKTGTFGYYGTADGLFKNTITDGLNMTTNGEMFIGFQNAFNFFDPARLRRNVKPPPVVIASMKVMEQQRRATVRNSAALDLSFFSAKLKWSKQDTFLLVKPGEDIFTIEFAALNFIQPNRNRYAYMLEGFDEDWRYTSDHSATYTNLDGGEYRFRVKAANNDGMWNETGASVKVRVVPPLGQRWYFQVLLALLGGLVVLGVWSYRRSQRRRIEVFRESLARDLHDEMGSTLSSIRFFSEFAKQKIDDGEAAETTPILQRISQSASALSESMQDIVWAMKTKNDQLDDLAARMMEFGLRLLESREIAFKTHIEAGFRGKSLSPELRRNLYLIFKEAVNNAAKYADATEVALLLAREKGVLRMKISDNGKGINGDGNGGTGGGNGLQNMRLRAAQIKGKLQIVSKKKQGTSIEVQVRV